MRGPLVIVVPFAGEVHPRTRVWGEIERWSFQDQLTLPYVLRASGLHWEPFPRDDFMEWAMSEKHMMANALNAAEVNMGAYLHG